LPSDRYEPLATAGTAYSLANIHMWLRQDVKQGVCIAMYSETVKHAIRLFWYFRLHTANVKQMKTLRIADRVMAPGPFFPFLLLIGFVAQFRFEIANAEYIYFNYAHILIASSYRRIWL